MFYFLMYDSANSRSGNLCFKEAFGYCVGAVELEVIKIIVLKSIPK